MLERFPGVQKSMDDTFESSHEALIAAADRMLSFAAGVVAPPSPDGTWDEPDPFDQYVATITLHIARLALPLPTLAMALLAPRPQSLSLGSFQRA